MADEEPVKIKWSLYKDFGEHEFACRCGCGRADMTVEFLEKLQTIRHMVDFVFPVSSGFRCPDYDKMIGGAGVHPTGTAVDLQLFGANAVTVVSLAFQFGFPRIGVSQRGPYDKRFVHLDCLISPDHPSPWIWTY